MRQRVEKQIVTLRAALETQLIRVREATPADPKPDIVDVSNLIDEIPSLLAPCEIHSPFFQGLTESFPVKLLR
jgi:hypothetical protein